MELRSLRFAKPWAAHACGLTRPEWLGGAANTWLHVRTSQAPPC
jgi:hypothetical protein